MFRFVFLIHSKSALAGILFFTGNFSRIFFFNLLSYILIISSFYSIPFWWYFLDIVGHLWYSSFFYVICLFFYSSASLCVCVVVYCTWARAGGLAQIQELQRFFYLREQTFFLENQFPTHFFLPPTPLMCLEKQLTTRQLFFCRNIIIIN